MGIERLGPDDIASLRALNALFAEAFEEPDNYLSTPPSDAYLQEQLGNPASIILVARDGAAITGGLVGLYGLAGHLS
ncbi:hypothetical protein [Sphingorhabdus contaminans]|uniref:hypothetical protein n=1 Tax=Sphingorhabdus contaminans TaxID=1343899 RepID=UPI003D2DF6AD